MWVHAARSALLLLAVAGCAHAPGLPDLDCAPRTLPTVRVAPLHEVVIQSNYDLVRETNRGRLRVLRALFESFGCTGPDLVERSTGPFRQPNLSCTLAGESADRIVVGAHFDRVAGGTGRVDNWSGAVLLPALRQSLSHRPRRHSFEFVAFSSEERGPAGSRSFVSSLDADGLRRIKAMVNIDGLGTGPLRAELSHSDPELLCDFWATSALVDMPLEARIAAPRSSGESEAFRRAGIPVIDLSSVTDRSAPADRARRNAAPVLDEKVYHEGYRLLAVYLAMLDARL